MSESNPVGRPTMYDPSFNSKVVKFCEMGATDMDIADLLGIDISTLYKWKQRHPELVEAIKQGKTLADERVEQSLYKRATGYSHPEEKIFCSDGVVVRAETTKHYAPDPTSMIYWLKNRKPKEWRDKHEMVLTGADGGPVKTENVNVSKLTLEELQTLDSLLSKASEPTEP